MNERNNCRLLSVVSTQALIIARFEKVYVSVSNLIKPGCILNQHPKEGYHRFAEVKYVTCTHEMECNSVLKIAQRANRAYLMCNLVCAIIQ